MNVQPIGLARGFLALALVPFVASCATTEDVKTASRQSLEKTEEVRVSLQRKIEEINKLQHLAEEQQAALEKLLNQARGELSTAQQRNAELETRVQEIKGQDLSVVQGQLETIRRDLDGLQSGFDDQKAQSFSLAARLSGIDKRVEATDKTVGQVTEMVKVVETKLSVQVEQQAQSLAKVTETVKVIGAKLSAQVEQQAQSLAKLEEATKQADGQTRDLSAKLMQLDTALKEFSKVLHSLNDRTIDMDRRVAESAGKTEGKVNTLVVQEGDRAARLDALRRQVEADGLEMKALVARAKQQTARLDEQTARLDAQEKTLNDVVATVNETSGSIVTLKRNQDELKESITRPAFPAEAPPEASPATPQQAPPAQRTSIPAEPSRPDGTAPRTAPVATLSDKEAYELAKQQYDKGQYDVALTAFRMFLEKYVDSTLVPNAHFWMAECYIRTRDFEPGIAEYKYVINHYPENEKAADALYQMAIVHLEMKDKSAAKAALQQLVNKYPKAEKINQARTKLASIK